MREREREMQYNENDRKVMKERMKEREGERYVHKLYLMKTYM